MPSSRNEKNCMENMPKNWSRQGWATDVSVPPNDYMTYGLIKTLTVYHNAMMEPAGPFQKINLTKWYRGERLT